MKKFISKVVIVLMLGVISGGTVIISTLHTVYAAEQNDNKPPADADNSSHDGDMGNMDMNHDHMNQN